MAGAGHGPQEGVAGGQAQTLADPLGQGAAFQEPVLSLEELLAVIVHRRGVVAADDFFGLTVELQRGLRGVDRLRQQSDNGADGDARRPGRHDRPAIFQQTAQVADHAVGHPRRLGAGVGRPDDGARPRLDQRAGAFAQYGDIALDLARRSRVLAVHNGRRLPDRV